MLPLQVVLDAVVREYNSVVIKLDRKEIPHDLRKGYTGTPCKLSVLVEEVGEVAKASNNKDSKDNLRQELIQVACMAIMWAESL